MIPPEMILSKIQPPRNNVRQIPRSGRDHSSSWMYVRDGQSDRRRQLRRLENVLPILGADPEGAFGNHDGVAGFERGVERIAGEESTAVIFG